MLDDVEPLVAAAAPEVREPLADVDVDVELPGGRRLVGTLGGLYQGADGPTLLRVEYSRLAPKQRIRAWVRLLALTATAPRPWVAVTIGRGTRHGVLRARLGPVAPGPAGDMLAELVALRDAGLREPLPLPTVAGHTYARSRSGGAGPGDAAEEALRRWSAGAGAERADDAHRLVWGPAAGPEVLLGPPGPAGGEPTRFGTLALALWSPLLLAQNEVRLMRTAFDVCGPLPTGTTVLEASAGTGKTFTIAALAARYLAEGRAELAELLLVTFGREATTELRERVRERLVSAERGLADPAAARSGPDEVLALLAQADDTEVAARRSRLSRALAQFDAATIATTHQFCQRMLAGLGVAGDADPDAVFVESVDDLLTEVVDDFYVRKYADHGVGAPAFSRAEALTMARRAVADGQARLEPVDAEPGSPADVRRRFAAAVRAEVARRKQAGRLYTYDDMLTRLDEALADPAQGRGGPAAGPLPGGAGRRVPGHRPGAVVDPAPGLLAGAGPHRSPWS